MAWEQVKVKAEKHTVMGMIKGDELEMPNVLIGKTLKIDGVLKITLAMASPKKEKSDDKPTKGSD